MTTVVEPEITRHTRQQNAVGLAQRATPRVAHLQRMLASQQPARHARQIDGDAEPRHGVGDRLDLVRAHQGLAADDGERALRGRERRGRPVECGVGCTRHGHGPGRRRRGVVAAGEHPLGVATEVPAQRAIRERTPFAGGIRVPLPDQRLVVQEVDRAFDEHRPRHAARGDKERFVDRGAKSATRLTRVRCLTCGATSER